MRLHLAAFAIVVLPLLSSGQCMPNRPLVTVTATAYEQVTADLVQLHLFIREPYTKPLSDKSMLSNTAYESNLKFVVRSSDRIDYFPEVVENSRGRYFVRKDIVITLTDRRYYPETIKKLLDLGYIVVQGVDFRTSQLEEYRTKALLQAMTSARKKAQLLAQSVGQGIGAAYSISEPKFLQQSLTEPVDSLGRRLITVDRYPENTGDITIAAEVTVSFDLK